MRAGEGRGCWHGRPACALPGAGSKLQRQAANRQHSRVALQRGSPGWQVEVAALACRMSSREYRPGSTPTCSGGHETGRQTRRQDKPQGGNHREVECTCRPAACRGEPRCLQAAPRQAGWLSKHTYHMAPLGHAAPRGPTHRPARPPTAHLCPAAHSVGHPHGKASLADKECVLAPSVSLGWVRDHARPRIQHQPRHKWLQPAGQGLQRRALGCAQRRRAACTGLCHGASCCAMALRCGRD